MSIVDYNTIRKAADTVAMMEKDVNRPDTLKEDETKGLASVRHNISMGPIVCITADTTRYCLRVGVRLFYEAGPIDKEIEERQENIVKLIRLVFLKKTLIQVNAETARMEILDKINSFLSAGKAQDLIFTVFDIIPMEMK